MPLQPERMIAELCELRALTEDSNGAQRVAWSPVWQTSRDWFVAKLAGLPLEHHFDAAGNLWITLAGESDRTLILGSHLDSVPNGGWLDGALGVLCGLEILRRFIEEYDGRPPITIRLVDFADEEGARFGRSMLGSSAFAGTHSLEADRRKTDRSGITLEEAVRLSGFDFDSFPEAGVERLNAAAYLELHIEQGPVLEALGLPLGVVSGTKGVERNIVIFHGQEAHSGTTPMEVRQDALMAAAKLALEIREIARRHSDAVCTVGSVRTSPGIATAVAGECELTLDQRDLNPAVLARMQAEAVAASQRCAAEEGCSVEWVSVFRIAPVKFDPGLMELCGAAIQETAGFCYILPSGALHDAAEVMRAGIPAVMMFVQSLKGISHNRIEDTREEHLIQAAVALDRLADKTVAWILRS